MSLRLIYGRAGSGKSQICFNEIKENINSGEKIYIITPEQFSYASEKKLLNNLNQKSVIKAEVITFNRMANRVFTEVGGIAKINLSKQGKAMLMSNILLESKNKLKFLGNSNDNANIILDTLADLKKHNVGVEDVQKLINNANDIYLKTKLEDIEIVYKKYQEHIKNKYIDDDDILTLLAKRLEDSKMFNNSLIYIDEFSGFTSQEYEIIRQLLKKADKVTVTICSDNCEETEDINSDIFYTNKKVIKKLIDCAKETKVHIEPMVNMQKKYRFKNKELDFLEENIYLPNYKIYNQQVNNIHLLLTTNPYLEIENVAKKIISLARNDGLKYSDISIIVKNIDTYSSIAKVLFAKYNIPVFIDKKSDLSHNILIKYVLSILEVFEKSWSHEAMFNYIKSGFIDLDRNTIYDLENYCVKWGIRGSKWYKEKWKFEEGRFCNIQSQIVSPLLQLRESLDNKKTVEDITKELYIFLENINIKEKLNKKIEELNEFHLETLANEYEGSWNILINILDEIVMIFANKEVSFEKYKNILKIGLTQSSLGKIPQAIDQVIMGDIDRSRSHRVKVTFILGVNDGIFPTAHKDEGFLNDNDRSFFEQSGLEIAKGTMEKLYEDQYNIYKAFTTAESEVYLSYVSTDKEGRAVRPSVLIHRIKQIFPRLVEESDIVNKKIEITLQETMFNELLANLNNLQEDKEDNIWIQIYNWYMNNEKWKDKLNKIIQDVDNETVDESIEENNIEKLYGNKLRTSVSRLEQYKKCPFSFYLKYGLKVKEKEELKIKPIDTGSFMHDTIDEFFNRVENIKDLEKQEINKIVEEIIESKLKLSKNYIFTSKPKFVILTNRLKKTVIKSIQYIVEQIKNSDFTIFGNEIEFNSIVGNIEIYGKIDRIDIAKNDDGDYVRIIDYKSSPKDLDIKEIEEGTQLQLITYMNLVAEKYNKIPSGMLYFNLIDPIISGNKNLSDKEIEEKIKKEFKMKGLVLSDIKVIKMMDKKLDTGMSDVIPVYIDKKGEISKGKSSTITIEEFKKLQKTSQELIKQIGNEILTGNIQIDPKYNKRTKVSACKYCEYKCICRAKMMKSEIDIKY